MAATTQRRGRVVILGVFPPPYGGVAIYDENLRRLLREADYDVLPLPYYPDETRGLTMARRLRENAHLFDSHTVCLDSARWLLEFPAIGNPLGLFYGLPMVWRRLKATRKFRWIKIVHDGSLPQRFPEFSRMQKFVFHQALRRVDRLVVVSEELRRWFAGQIGYKKPISVIPSLLPIAVPEPSPIMPKQGKIVCAIGVFTPDYGFRDVAEVIEALRDAEEQNIELWLVDGGFSEDAAYRRETLANREWIRICREVPHPQVLQLLYDADVFVRPFRYESYGLSRIEALWCGTPVVATNAGEQRGMRLFNFGDKEGLRCQLQATLNAPADPEVTRWAQIYEQEARGNLLTLQELIEETLAL